jgi:hypothetical protein
MFICSVFSFGGGGWHEKGILANVKRVIQWLKGNWRAKIQ